MAVTFKVEHFEGPLDLLLQLVEQEEFDISTVSLAKVTEQYVQHVNESKNIPLEEMADFLVVAAKLMYLKSKLLLPEFLEQNLEEGPDLETQLREYQRFVAASRLVNKMWNEEKSSFPRERSLVLKTDGFVPPIGLAAELLCHMMRRVIARLEPLIKLPQVHMERVVTIQERIKELCERVKRHVNTTFKLFLQDAKTKTKTEAIISFLALLELVKQRCVLVDQRDLFHDIQISYNSSYEY